MDRSCGARSLCRFPRLVQIRSGDGPLRCGGKFGNRGRAGKLIATLDATDCGLRDAEMFGGRSHGEIVFGSPLKQVHAPNIRIANDTSSAFHTFAGLQQISSLAQQYFMAKKSKRRPTFIKEWRKHRGLTQEQLAERLGLTQATIARIERGEISYTQPVLEAMADALRCEPADLIMRDPTHHGSIWSIWDQIPATERDQAAKVLQTFIKKAS